MSEHHGAYGEADATASGAIDGATNDQTIANAQPGGAASGSGSTDASLESRARGPRGGRGGANGGRRGGTARRWLWIVIALVAVVAITVGVLVSKPGRVTGSDTVNGNGGRAADRIAIGLKLAPTNLDIRNQSGSALDQLLIGNVYEGLVARDQDNQVVPALAKAWDVSDDGLTYTFHLNERMTFSNGDVLDADDVVWSINDLIDNQYHDADSVASIANVEASDTDTVVMTLSSPDSNLLWALTGRAGLVLDQDADYDAKTEAVGSGPYTVARFTVGDSVTLTANERYWGEDKARTPTIVVKYYVDDNAAVNALKSGDVQVLAPITETLAAPFAADTDHYTVKAGDDTDKYVLAFNNKGEKTSDKRIRQAIRYAIDHDEIIASRGGSDAALGGPIPSLDPGYEDLTDLYPHDLDKAKKLMAEAGYDEDHPLELRLTYANTYASELGDQLRSQLKPIGIDLKVNVVEFSTWLQDVYTNRDYDLSLVDHNESHDFYQWADPDYYYGYDNKQVQDLYAQAIAATDDRTRDELLAKAARIVSEDAPADWLLNYRVTTVWAAGVDGFPVNLNQSVMDLRNVTYVK
ncbi:ABC transporter substrate-binding protein [Bifidobacterium samirii]|uniref:ABC transporter substrate-binding protein n=1 Tax=Bifidobacterium samirii TaxID=2306974 RepID=A0A430FW02_9BIFI|nr:ABC transporter substrate-binding protein [Bifidobacterium samirii]RSX58112.1 ABC transporter substrate-binding protein [Bifidobacterium samirii]